MHFYRSSKSFGIVLFLTLLLAAQECDGLEAEVKVDKQDSAEKLQTSFSNEDDKAVFSNATLPTVEDSDYNNGTEKIVETTSGPVIGTTSKSSDGKVVNVYYGIPYAASPTGPLRFRPPVKVSPWSTPLKAFDSHYICYQHLSFTVTSPVVEHLKTVLSRPWSEDCLKLTVWSPRPKVTGAPVLAYVHGGAFILGSSMLFTDGTDLAASGVVVVAFNYRLGVFGFFDMGHPEAPGNVGLMDQTLALRWIQENVEAFGGDPSKVTLLGVSAGAASVGYHLLSPMSKGLFGAAVLIGGAPTKAWALKEKEQATLRSTNLVEALGCSNTNVSLALGCIRGKDAEDVQELSSLPAVLLGKEHFVPTVDGEFLTENPFDSLEAGRIASRVPVLVSTAVKEGSVFMAPNLNSFRGLASRADFERVIRAVDRTLTKHQTDLMQVFYTNWSQPDDLVMLRDAACDLFGDYLITCGANRFTDSIAKVDVPVFRSVFDYVSPLQQLINGWMHPVHGAEYNLLMGSHATSGLTTADKPLARKIKQHILNFLTSRDPNLNKEDFHEEPTWPLYKSPEKKLLRFAARSRIESGYRIPACRFLDEVDSTLSKC